MTKTSYLTLFISLIVFHIYIFVFFGQMVFYQTMSPIPAVGSHLVKSVLLLQADAQILANCTIRAPLSMAPDEKPLYNSNKFFVSLY